MQAELTAMTSVLSPEDSVLCSQRPLGSWAVKGANVNTACPLASGGRLSTDSGIPE